MQTTTIVAPSSRIALERVAEMFGPDAVVYETRTTRHGVEVVAGGIERRTLTPEPHRAPEMISSPVSAPVPQPKGKDPMVRFIAQSRAVGIDPEFLTGEMAAAGTDLADAWSRFLIRVEREVKIAPPPHTELAHVCVVGDNGSAKTTTLAQLAAMARASRPGERITLLSGDRRPGAREQLRVIGAILKIPVVEPARGESLAEAARRLARKERLFIDMPSDPRLAACEVEELRAALDRAGTLTVLCTMPLSGQLARHRQIADMFSQGFDAYVLTHAGETLPPGAVLTMLLSSGVPLAGIGRSADFAGGYDAARATGLCRMVAAALSTGATATLQ